MEYKDYYKTLGVEKTATDDEIKRAYRKLARKYHPDLNKDPEAEATFKDVGEAHEVLSDPEKRAAYDQIGQGYRPGQDFRPPPDWDAGFEFSGAGNEQATEFSDFFETLFGGEFQRRRQRPGQAEFRTRRRAAKGEDHHAKVLVDLEDAFEGAKRSIVLRLPELTDDGRLAVRERTLQVTIPKGVREGQHIRLKGQGAPGLGGGEAGDLFLEVAFRPHPLYTAEGTDLYLDLPVAPWEAALGAKVKVPTPGGVIDLTIPAGSRQGRKLRVKGRGLPAKTPGDLYVTLQIAMPPAASPAAKAAWEKLAQECAFDPRRDMMARAGARSA